MTNFSRDEILAVIDDPAALHITCGWRVHPLTSTRGISGGALYYSVMYGSTVFHKSDDNFYITGKKASSPTQSLAFSKESISHVNTDDQSFINKHLGHRSIAITLDENVPLNNPRGLLGGSGYKQFIEAGTALHIIVHEENLAQLSAAF